MNAKNINSVIAVVPVKDFDKAIAWYKKLFGRDADVLPMEGIAEWELVENAWIQISADPERASGTTVVIGVNDVEEQFQACSDADMTIGEITEYPEIVKLVEIFDPEGNKISFVQDISNG